MPVVEDQYVKRTEEEVLAALTAELKTQFGVDIDLTESSVFSTLASVHADTNVELFEQELQDVFNSAYLSSAEGQQLDELVKLIGISRQEASFATGVVEFGHGSRVSTSYAISNGTVITTEGSNPKVFETTSSEELTLFDDFEQGVLSSAYDGDSGDYSVSATNPIQESYSLVGPSSPVSDSLIYQISTLSQVGKTFAYDVDIASGSNVETLFGFTSTSDYYAIHIDETNDEHEIAIYVGGSKESLASETITIDADIYYNEVEWVPRDGGTIVSKLYDSGDTLISEIEVTDESRIERGGFGFKTLASSAQTRWDWYSTISVQADARSQESGANTNVGSNTLIVLPSIPNGVQSVTNPFAMGDTNQLDTTFDRYRNGSDEESDAELRERVEDSVGTGGKGTADAIIAELRTVDDVQSVTVIENKSDSPDGDGRPAYSFEAVVYGGLNQDIADALHESKSFTAQDVGGYAGTQQTASVLAENGQVFDYFWSNPTEIAVDMTLDIVVNENYIGDSELKDRIVDYIGGIMSDGSEEFGLDVAEDVYHESVADEVVGPDDTGVIGIQTYSYTPALTTDAYGLEIVDIGASEVATTDATDGSITLNVTTI